MILDRFIAERIVLRRDFLRRQIDLAETVLLDMYEGEEHEDFMFVRIRNGLQRNRYYLLVVERRLEHRRTIFWKKMRDMLFLS